MPRRVYLKRWRRSTAPALFVGQSCPYCSWPMREPTRDHIHPRTRGGTAIHKGRPNILVCCAICNADKGRLDLGEWWLRLSRANDARAPLVLGVLVKWTIEKVTPNGPARDPIGDQQASRGADLDDAGRARDTA